MLGKYNKMNKPLHHDLFVGYDTWYGDDVFYLIYFSFAFRLGVG